MLGSSEPALARYCAMLELLERAQPSAPALIDLQRSLSADKSGGGSASAQIRSLSAIVGFLDARRNEAFRLFIGPLLLWDVHVLWALEGWQARTGLSARGWLATRAASDICGCWLSSIILSISSLLTVLPGTLYRIIGVETLSATAEKCATRPRCGGLL